LRPSDASRRREAIVLLAPAGFYAGISLHEPIHTALVNRLMRALGERGLVLAVEARSGACFSRPSPSQRIRRIPFLAPSVSASPSL